MGRNWTLWCSYCRRRYKKNEGTRNRTLDGRETYLCPNCKLGRDPPRIKPIDLMADDPIFGQEEEHIISTEAISYD